MIHSALNTLNSRRYTADNPLHCDQILDQIDFKQSISWEQNQYTLETYIPSFTLETVCILRVLLFGKSRFRS